MTNLIPVNSFSSDPMAQSLDEPGQACVSRGVQHSPATQQTNGTVAGSTGVEYSNHFKEMSGCTESGLSQASKAEPMTHEADSRH